MLKGEKCAGSNWTNMPYFDVEALKRWFQEEKRDLPWRKNPTPYAVWISEVMLQQTQASVVIPYFTRWMERFPNVHVFAEAPFQEVIKLWEGLGYYSRARNLHEAAKIFSKEYQGNIPSNKEQLKKIKGIGPYTQGAILSFAFHQKAAAVDGNVMRVLSRYFLIEEEIEKAKAKIIALTESILPDFEPWVVMEGLIELGAQICRKKPECTRCPLKSSCLGHLHRKAELLPIKKKRETILQVKRAVPILIYEKKLLVGRVGKKKIMEDLYEFPYIELQEEEEHLSMTASKVRELKILAELLAPLKNVKHSFTRYRATLFPSIWKAKEAKIVEDFEWKSFEEVLSLPFSSGHKQILEQLQDAYFTH
jgi:A/G-specific adenine glycosylase